MYVLNAYYRKMVCKMRCFGKAIICLDRMHTVWFVCRKSSQSEGEEQLSSFSGEPLLFLGLIFLLSLRNTKGNMSKS